jgi:hypothetical protein
MLCWFKFHRYVRKWAEMRTNRISLH